MTKHIMLRPVKAVIVPAGVKLKLDDRCRIHDLLMELCSLEQKMRGMSSDMELIETASITKINPFYETSKRINEIKTTLNTLQS